MRDKRAILLNFLNKEILLYLIFGVLTTIINFGIFIGGIALVGNAHYLGVNLCAFLGATIFAFVTNKIFVFESKTWSIKCVIKELLSFFGCRIGSFLIIEEFGLFVSVELFKLDQLDWFIDGTTLSKIILSFIAVLINYIVSKLLIFKK